ncbi:MAG: hypothetical protein AB7E61_03965 [Acholeplasmataceae bacterium]
MKKYLILFATMMMMMSLAGCVTDPPTYYFNAAELKENVIKIELVDFVNEKPAIVIVDDNTMLSINMANATLIKELNNEEVNSFIEDLSTITFHVENKSVNSPLGHTVIMYMKNQEIAVLSCTVVDGLGYSMAAVFTVEGEFVEHIANFADEPKFREILEKYFDI